MFVYCAVLPVYADNNCFQLKLSLCVLVVYSGVQLSEFQTRSAVRTCGLSFSGNLVMYTTDKAMSQPCEMLIYDLRDDGQMSKFSCFSTVERSVLDFAFVLHHAMRFCHHYL